MHSHPSDIVQLLHGARTFTVQPPHHPKVAEKSKPKPVLMPHIAHESELWNATEHPDFDPTAHGSSADEIKLLKRTGVIILAKQAKHNFGLHLRHRTGSGLPESKALLTAAKLMKKHGVRPLDISSADDVFSSLLSRAQELQNQKSAKATTSHARA